MALREGWCRQARATLAEELASVGPEPLGPSSTPTGSRQPSESAFAPSLDQAVKARLLGGRTFRSLRGAVATQEVRQFVYKLGRKAPQPLGVRSCRESTVDPYPTRALRGPIGLGRVEGSSAREDDWRRPVLVEHLWVEVQILEDLLTRIARLLLDVIRQDQRTDQVEGLTNSGSTWPDHGVKPPGICAAERIGESKEVGVDLITTESPGVRFVVPAGAGLVPAVDVVDIWGSQGAS